MKARRNSESGIRNVHYDPEREKWVVEIRTKDKRIRRRFPGDEDGKNEAAAWAHEQRRRLGIR